MSFDTLTVIVLVNVVVTIALWLEATRRPPQTKLKKKFVKRLLHSEPITPKHQPPKTIDSSPREFFDDFADFANVVNQGVCRLEPLAAARTAGDRARLATGPVRLCIHARPKLCGFSQSGAGRQAWSRARFIPRPSGRHHPHSPRLSSLAAIRHHPGFPQVHRRVYLLPR
jgi:hypothetical protein